MSIKNTIITKTRSAVLKSLGLSDLARAFAAGLDITKKDTEVTQPYRQLETVFACVTKRIEGVKSMAAGLMTYDNRLIESGPLYNLLFENPNLSWDELITQTIGHYSLTRDVFWVFTDWIGNTPSDIMVVSGLQMHPITHNGRADGELVGWEFRGLGGQRQKLGLYEVHQWKNFNPYDRFHGLGPLAAAQLSMNYSYAAAKSNASALANGNELGLIISMPGNPTPEEKKAFVANFESRHCGPSNAKRTALVTGGAKVETIAQSMVDMEVARLTEMSDTKICMSYGVRPELLGLKTEAQYSHGPAQDDFIFNTIMPLCRSLGDHIDIGIISHFHLAERSLSEPVDTRWRTAYKQLYRSSAAANKKLFLWFDFDQHPVVQAKTRERTKEVLEHTKYGVPLNQVIEHNDLPYEPVPWGNDYLVSMGLVPAAQVIADGYEGSTGPAGKEGDDDEKMTEAQQIWERHKAIIKAAAAEPLEKTGSDKRRKIWQKWVASWRPLERQYQEAMRKYFLRQERILVKKLRDTWNQSRRVEKSDSDIIARVTFDFEWENGKIKQINHAMFEKSSDLGIAQTLNEILGLTGDDLKTAVEQVKRLPAIKEALVTSSAKLGSINTVTAERIAAKLAEGLSGGENLEQLIKRIKAELGANRARALRIARTQTAGAVSSGRHAGMSHAGVELKAWLTSADDEVRDLHANAQERYADGIPLDEPFVLGFEPLMYPGDPHGSAANIINCRCVQIAVKAKGKSIPLDRWLKNEFLREF